MLLVFGVGFNGRLKGLKHFLAGLQEFRFGGATLFNVGDNAGNIIHGGKPHYAPEYDRKGGKTVTNYRRRLQEDGGLLA